MAKVTQSQTAANTRTSPPFLHYASNNNINHNKVKQHRQTLQLENNISHYHTVYSSVYTYISLALRFVKVLLKFYRFIDWTNKKSYKSEFPSYFCHNYHETEIKVNLRAMAPRPYFCRSSTARRILA